MMCALSVVPLLGTSIWSRVSKARRAACAVCVRGVDILRFLINLARLQGEIFFWFSLGRTPRDLRDTTHTRYGYG